MDNKWVWFVSFCLPRGPEFCQDVFCFARVCGSISRPFLVVKSLWSFTLLYNSLVHNLFCLECACVVPHLSLHFSVQFSRPLCSKWWQGAALYPHAWLCFFLSWGQRYMVLNGIDSNVSADVVCQWWKIQFLALFRDFFFDFLWIPQLILNGNVQYQISCVPVFRWTIDAVV